MFSSRIVKTSSSDKKATSKSARSSEARERTETTKSARSSEARERTEMWTRRLYRAIAAWLLLSLLASCGAAKTVERPGDVPGVSGAALHPPVDFSFDSLDDQPVSAQASRGKPTVIAFMTTSSLSSQAQVDFLIAMANTDGPLVNYFAVALEGRENREIVELYKKALSIPFPVAIADPETLAGASAFGDVSAVPVTVVLDRAGHIAWRVDGRVAKSAEVRAAMRGL